MEAFLRNEKQRDIEAKNKDLLVTKELVEKGFTCDPRDNRKGTHVDRVEPLR